MTVSLSTPMEADAWAFVRALVTISLVSNSRYAKDRALDIIETEVGHFVDANTRGLVTLFAQLGMDAEDIDVKTWYAERVGILLEFDITRIPHAQGKRPDFPCHFA